MISTDKGSVKGNPAFFSWLVIAIAITVPDLRLNRPSKLRLSEGCPLVSQSFFGHSPLLHWIEFRQLPSQAGSLLLFRQEIDGGLQGAAAVWILAFTHPTVQIRNGPLSSVTATVAATFHKALCYHK